MANIVTPAAVPVALPIAPVRQKASRLDGFQEVDTQPLFYRLKLAASTNVPALGKIDAFVEKKNLKPHLTNCEEAGSMPNTCGYRIAGIELVPNANCSAAAFRAMLAASRLVIEVGTKGMEKMNQPAVFFGSASRASVIDTSATVREGVYRLNPGEEINLEPDQPFRVYLQMDDAGFTVPAGETLDFYVKFWGQKRGRVSLG